MEIVNEEVCSMEKRSDQIDIIGEGVVWALKWLMERRSG